jgi:glycosyltransferase involved in cell wall biosynthesis
MNTVLTLLGLSSRFVGGSETYARELSEQLAERGWRSVICFLDEPPKHVRQYLALSNVSIEVLPNAVTPNQQALRDFAGLLRRHQPDIIHLQLVGFIHFYPWLAKLLSAKKVFFTDQGSHPSDYVARRAKLWKRLAVRVINLPMSKVICVSRYNYDNFKTRDILPESRFEVIYNSADFSRIQETDDRRQRFRAKHGIPEDRAVILQVSMVIPEKGTTDLLEAVRLVREQNPNVHLVLAGEGAHRAEFTALGEKLGLSGHVTWTGVISDPFAEGAYDAADVVCQVSRWQEAFGQTIAEAMACRKPVIGTRVGGIPELIHDGKSGYLVDARDSKAIAEKINLLLSDPQLRERMGENGYEIAQSRFDLRKNVRRVLQLYGITNGAGPEN